MTGANSGAVPIIAVLIPMYHTLGGQCAIGSGLSLLIIMLLPIAFRPIIRIMSAITHVTSISAIISEIFFALYSRLLPLR